MRLTSESDILNEATRKAVIDEINGSENTARKAEYLKRYEIYKDNTKKYVVEALRAEGLKDTTVAQMANRASNISICRKIVNKKARAYSSGVSRDVAENELADIQLSELARHLAFDSKMKKGDRYRELHKNSMFQVVPELDTAASFDGPPKYKLKLNTLAPWQYDVVEDYYDREKALVVVISDFADASSPKSDGKDNAIADAPEDANKGSKKQYVWWSNHYHFTTDEAGKIVADKSPDGGLNPIEILPFVNNSEDQDGQFWAKGGDDLIEGSILINKLMTDMNFIAYLQGFGQVVVTGKNIQEKNFSWGPNNACLIEYSEEDPKPSVDILSANPPLDSWREVVQQHIALLLTTNNLSPSSVSINLSATNSASGIAMIIEQSESTDSVIEKQKEYVILERQLWEITRRWFNLYYEASALNESLTAIGKLPDDLPVSIRFLEAKPVVSEAERLNNIKLRKELGINEAVDLILADNPDMTRDEAKEKLERIKTQETEGMAGFVKGLEDHMAQPTTETNPTLDAKANPKAIKPTEALNGAQVDSLMQIIERVGLGSLPKESAKTILVAAFNLDETLAEEILRPIQAGTVQAAETTVAK